ncbi:membrane protein insertase YidC [Corynebacterium timonense]|uniref:Membrane protein insertase YidC n=1 Tax=Corynebacterium timonense TaxID=441500 RepID=A0A1H1UX71_9CORY|nr:membrane protein insertase YidC [Corynebacterium timonense]SDS76686.1 YidC/Oxa1 family membrane protein insertase [Corynebacterium timonense]
MIEAFVYPVSAVMKLWHWLLGPVLGVPSSGAWVASVILLVVTIRALVAPLTWMSFRTSRVIVLMRPQLAALEEQYGTDTTPEGVREHEQARREVHKEHRYNPFTGCLPLLIQLPFFLGLYRLLLWMAVPDRAEGHSLGLLTPEDVASFQQASFFGVPLPAYVAMSPEQFALLGTTLDDVRSVAIPMLACALFFTTFNMVLSQLRTRSTLEWNDRAARTIYRLIWVAVPFVPLLIGMAGLTGLVPVALLLYWFTGNLWTLGQTIVLWWLVVRVHPLGEDAREHIAASRAALDEQLAAKKETKRSRRSRRLKALARPSTIPAVRREIAAEKAEAKREKAEAKLQKKELARKRQTARREASRRERSAAKDADQPEDQME